MYRYTYAYTYRCTHLWMYMGTYPYTYNVLLACIHGGHFSLLPLWLGWQLIWSAGVKYIRTASCVVGMLTWRPVWPFAFMDKRRQLPLFAGVVYTRTGTCICTHMRIRTGVRTRICTRVHTRICTTCYWYAYMAAILAFCFYDWDDSLFGLQVFSTYI